MGITNKSMQILFGTLSSYCPFLKSIDLLQTNISNQACLAIYKYFINPSDQNKNNNSSRLIHIKLYGTKIDSNGIQLLSKPSKASNLIKTKIYHDKMTSLDNKRKPQYQRSIRDLMQKKKEIVYFFCDLLFFFMIACVLIVY